MGSCGYPEESTAEFAVQEQACGWRIASWGFEMCALHRRHVDDGRCFFQVEIVKLGLSPTSYSSIMQALDSQFARIGFRETWIQA